MSELSVNVPELKEYLTHIINTNKELQKKELFPIAVNVKGIAGIGKTSVIKQLAKELDHNFVKLSLSQIDELGDLIGIPCRQFQMVKNNGTDQAPKWSNPKWADETLLNDYKEKGYKVTGKDRTYYSLPEWVPEKENTIILLDDFSRCQQRFMQAVMEIVSEQEYISWKLPKNCTVILSSNPDDGAYHVASEDIAMKTRYSTINLEFDREPWALWAEGAGIDNRCINFLLMNSDLVTEECNARAITNFFNSISTFEKFEESLPMIQMLGEGSTGIEFASMFAAFINDKLDKLIDPETMLTHDSEEYVIKTMKSVIGTEDSYRADIASALCTRFVNYSIVYAEEKTVTQKIINRITSLITENIFQDDLQYYAFREILNGHKTKFKGLTMDPELAKMATR